MTGRDAGRRRPTAVHDVLRTLTWNIARRADAWRLLLDSDADIALLQEAAEPPPDEARRIDVDPAPWRTAGAGFGRPLRTVEVGPSERVDVQ